MNNNAITENRKIKIVGISSSPSWNGSTSYLVREALMAARAAGAEVEEIRLADYRIDYCQGCFRCMSSGTCPIKDDFLEVKAKLLAADGIIIGSPTYGMAPNAIMKGFLDRLGMYTVYTSELADKYVVGISTAGAVGSKKVASSLTGIVGGFFRRGKVSGTLGAKVGWGQAQDRPALRLEAERLGRKLFDDIARGRPYRLQGLPQKLLQKLILGRVMRKNVLENQDGRMSAVYQSLRSRGFVD